MEDSDFIIRETEPTSIAAYALSSKHYKDEIFRIRNEAVDDQSYKESPKE